MKKFKKSTDLDIYSPKGFLEGLILAFGRVGGGKSVSALSIVQGYHDNYNYKIWDMFGGERCEQLYWALPSVDDSYWQTKISQIGKFDEQGPKQYKVRFLYPYFGTKIPKKLPIKIINKEIIVDSLVFTIPLKSVIVEDVATVIGIVSETARYCWNEIIERANKKDNAGSLIDIASKVKGITNTPLYKNFVLPMSREKFLMDNYCETNIDLVNESKDRETIAVLCLDFVPKAFHIFILNWISRNLNDLLDANKIPKKNICFIREAATFFRATEDSVLDDRFKIFRTNMTNYMRMSRRGVYFCLEENTKIISDHKNKKIKDLPNSFNVKSYNLKKKKIEDSFAVKKYIGQKECYKIIMDGGSSIIATGEHKFFDKNKKEIEVKKLNKGDELLKW